MSCLCFFFFYFILFFFLQKNNSHILLEDACSEESRCGAIIRYIFHARRRCDVMEKKSQNLAANIAKNDQVTRWVYDRSTTIFFLTKFLASSLMRETLLRWHLLEFFNFISEK